MTVRALVIVSGLQKNRENVERVKIVSIYPVSRFRHNAQQSAFTLLNHKQILHASRYRSGRPTQCG